MSKIIAIAHRKGGVGKTTTTVHLSTGLASMGLPVVGIDLDAQGNLGEFLGLGRAPDVYDLLMARQPERVLDNVLTAVPKYPRLFIVRGDDETKGAERALSDPTTARSLTSALQRAIQVVLSWVAARCGGRTPYVFLDTPPGLGMLQLAALTVADYLLIPVNPSFASETGIPKVADEVRSIRTHSGRGAQLLGIIPTRYKVRTLEHQAVVENLKRTFGEAAIYPPVGDTVRLEEAPGRGLPVWEYDPSGSGARDYARVLWRLARDLGIALSHGGGNGNGNGHKDRGGK